MKFLKIMNSRCIKLSLISISLLVISACSSFSLELATPFKVVSDVKENQRYLVIATYTEFKKDGTSKTQFNKLVDDILDNIEESKGLYGYSVRRDFLGNSAWTYTIWEEQSAMRSFKVSPSHLNAMKSASKVLETAMFASTQVTTDELPYSWESALQLLKDNGRTYDYASKSYSASPAE